MRKMHVRETSKVTRPSPVLCVSHHTHAHTYTHAHTPTDPETDPTAMTTNDPIHPALFPPAMPLLESMVDVCLVYGIDETSARELSTSEKGVSEGKGKGGIEGRREEGWTEGRREEGRFERMEEGRVGGWEKEST